MTAHFTGCRLFTGNIANKSCITGKFAAISAVFRNHKKYP